MDQTIVVVGRPWRGRWIPEQRIFLAACERALAEMLAEAGLPPDTGGDALCGLLAQRAGVSRSTAAQFLAGGDMAAAPVSSILRALGLMLEEVAVAA